MSEIRPAATAPSIRRATPQDADRIAALHVASWRAAYRGILDEAFLDGPVEADRLALWRERLSSPTADQVLLVAETRDALTGFVCCYADHDARWGSYIHNLHADPAARGHGVGRALMGALASDLESRAPDRPVHLFCLAANGPAQGFYERIGGEVADRQDLPEPDGRIYPCLLYAWASPARLADGVG